MEEAKIVVKVERIRCRGFHNSKLGLAKVAAGDPHVLFFHDSPDFATLIKGLAEDGYSFEVVIEDREVSVIEWYATEVGTDAAERLARAQILK